MSQARRVFNCAPGLLDIASNIALESEVASRFEFLCVLCGFSFANFAVKGSCSEPKSKDSNRKVREEKAAKCAKKFKLMDCRIR